MRDAHRLYDRHGRQEDTAGDDLAFWHGCANALALSLALIASVALIAFILGGGHVWQ